MPQSRIPFWAWLPVPLFLALILGFHAWGSETPYESVLIGLASNILLSSGASLLVVALVSHGFVKSGSPALLFLSCGVLAWACASSLALYFGGYDANRSVTIHNLGSALAGAFHLAGVLLIGRRKWVIRSAGVVLSLALAGTASAMILIVLVSRAQILPVFFVPGQGGTWTRQAVLGAAFLMFAVAATLLLLRPAVRDSSFDRWYGLALALVAVGLFGVMTEHNVGSAVSWLGRSAQCLSGIYMLVAALAGLRKANLLTISLEDSLQQTHELLDTVTQAAGVIVAVLDRDLRYSYFNRAYAEEMRRVLGRQVEFGMLATDFLASSPEQRDPLVREWRQVLEGDSLHQTIALGGKGSRRRFYLDHKTPIRDKQGAVVGASEVAIDISERKLAEDERENLLKQLRETQDQLYAELDAMTRLQRLGTLLPREAGLATVLNEIIGVAVAISDADFGNIQIIDPVSHELKMVAHRGFEDWWLKYWDNVSRGHGACGSALERGERIVVEDVETSPYFVGTPGLEMQRRAGVRACQSTPLISRSGEVLGMFSTHYRNAGRPEERALRLLDLLARQASDVIEGVQAGEALRSANAQLIEGDRRKNEFLAALSHELRNPLAPISNSLFVLDHAPAGSEQAERAKEIIARQVGQLSALVNDLLDITRITRNKIQLNRDRLDLNEAVRLALEDNRSCFERAHVQLELIPSPGPIPVLADRTRVAQIVGNLLSNSAKFTGEGGHTRVSLACEGGEAVLRIADDGIGLDARTVQHLFEPFVQAEQSLDRSKGGLGLGLALVKALAELHGGSVSAHSEGHGRGSEFTVRLPLDVVERAEAVPPDAPKSCPRRRVLIIEDNIDAANSLCEALEFLGHQVEVAHTGSEGIAKAERRRPEAILCDIGLPQMDGYQVARALRANREFEETYLVALSGYALPEDIENALQAGFDRHLSKPPSLEMLEGILLELDAEGRSSP